MKCVKQKSVAAHAILNIIHLVMSIVLMFTCGIVVILNYTLFNARIINAGKSNL